MRKALNRASRYGWSKGYAYNPGSRQFNSDPYLNNYDEIEWNDRGYDETWEQTRRPGEGYNKGSVVMKKRFNMDRTKSVTHTAGKEC